jgi:hypothetical protein
MPDGAPYVFEATRATWVITAADEGVLQGMSRRFRDDPHVDKVERLHRGPDLFLRVTFKNGYGAPLRPELGVLRHAGGELVVEPSQAGRKGRKGGIPRTAYDLIGMD